MIGDNPPEGFTLLPVQVEADYAAGPYYIGRRDGRPVLGFRVKERHLNPNRVCHGGVIANFADMVSTVLEDEPGMPQIMATITLSVDYMGPTPVGAWVEAMPDSLHVSGRMLFTKTVIAADGVPVARSSGCFRITRSGRPAPAAT